MTSPLDGWLRDGVAPTEPEPDVPLDPKRYANMAVPFDAPKTRCRFCDELRRCACMRAECVYPLEQEPVAEVHPDKASDRIRQLVEDRTAERTREVLWGNRRWPEKTE